jgi:hypothetical protein
MEVDTMVEAVEEAAEDVVEDEAVAGGAATRRLEGVMVMAAAVTMKLPKKLAPTPLVTQVVTHLPWFPQNATKPK